MSMLSEQRRKTKWVINPTKKPIWSTDSSGIKFGKQLMEKMGWSAGKGLGANEQGMQEPLKVSFKNDTKGMGFKGNDDDWIEHQDEFNILLNQLRNTDDPSVVKETDVEKNEIKSLEEKSKQSKARVHYQKFTRGKDLSKYSENDLACILGTGKTKKKEKPKPEEVVKTKTEITGNYETSFGVTTINSGSIQDYFKNKWRADKLEQNDSLDVVNEEENFRPSSSNGNIQFPMNDELSVKPDDEEFKFTKKKQKSKSEKEQLHEEESMELQFHEADAENIEKKKRKKVEINSEEEPEKKKKKRKYSDDLGDSVNNGSLKETDLPPENENGCKEKRKKDRKQKIEILNDEVNLGKEEKHKKRAQRSLEENVNDYIPESEEMNNASTDGNLVEVESVKRKSKKKAKKEKKEEAEENKCNMDEIQAVTGNMDEHSLEAETVQHKKKKKEKLEMYETGSKIKNSYVELADTEEISGAGCDEESGKKKKKKKEKKEKIEECHKINEDEKCPSEVISGESNDKNEIENSLSVESGKKKQKKKAKIEKLNENKEIENENCHADHIEESYLAEPSCDHFEEDDKLSSIKKKKKKKDKEKLRDVENEACLEEEKIEENLESVRKKKKKKHKKEKKENDDEQQSCQPNGNEELSMLVNNEIEKPDDETISQGIEENGVLTTNKEGEDRLQKLRANLFPDKDADKYFPEQGTNDRVLRLIRWANIKEFKGSNLSDLEGYGRRKLYQKQSR